MATVNSTAMNIGVYKFFWIDVGFLCLLVFFCHVFVEKDFEITSGQAGKNADVNTFSIEKIMSESHRKIIKANIDAFDIKLTKFCI